MNAPLRIAVPSKGRLAAATTQLLRDAGVAKVIVKYVPGYETSRRAGPQHYEIWFARAG